MASRVGTNLAHQQMSQRATVSVRVLSTGLIGAAVLMQWLLWAFLGRSWLELAFGGAAGVGLILALGRYASWPARSSITLRDLALCMLIALVLLLLGGEGRLFYANTDWQVRNAVLHDLVEMPWPWLYQGPHGLTFLRCPIGIYLLPGLIGKLGGLRAADLSMLVQNAVLLGTVFALASTLYRNGRERLTTLALFLGFSGLDIVGQALVGHPLIAHPEGWAGLQYSAMLTMVFWVPQHLLAGLVGTVFYLLWREGRAPLVALLVWCPLALLLSPLSVFGLLPLAALAGAKSLFGRALGWPDLALPALATALALPSLAYLAAGSGTVGGGSGTANGETYMAFYALEILPFLLVLMLTHGHWRFDRLTVLLCAACLLLYPFGRIGQSVDFMMRASIPQLAILALLLADVMARRLEATAPLRLRTARTLAVTLFAIGLVVPLGEIVRAIVLPPAPAMQCSYYGVVPEGAATYVADADSLAGFLRPRSATIVSPRDPAACWDTPWPDAATDWRGQQRALFGGRR